MVSRKPRSRFVKGLLYTCYLLIVIFLGLEIALRIFNPFHFRLKGDKIVLPVSQTTTIRNTLNPKLDAVILNTRNALGLRGPEKPPEFDQYLSIITVGGSTTECRFLNDQNTWPYVTGTLLSQNFNKVWLNNAGLDGHSTFGHEILLNDYLLKIHPKVITFLVGINDVENDQPTFHDKLNMKGGYADFKHFLFENSEVLNLLLNYSRGWRAQKMNNTTQKQVLLEKGDTLYIPPAEFEKRLNGQQPYLVQFHKRIAEIMDTCLAHEIVPVFLTQPNLFGQGVDSATGVDLKKFKVAPGLNGELEWQMLEKYNEVTRNTCAAKAVFLIDLASQMPKNSIYYYDGSHFTNTGARKVAELVAASLTPYLAKRFPRFHTDNHRY